jgi:hypothetical protein
MSANVDLDGHAVFRAGELGVRQVAVWAATFIGGKICQHDVRRQVGVVPTSVSGLAWLLTAPPTAGDFFQTWQNLCRIAFLCLAAEQLLTQPTHLALQSVNLLIPLGDTLQGLLVHCLPVLSVTEMFVAFGFPVLYFLPKLSHFVTQRFDFGPQGDNPRRIIPEGRRNVWRP